MTSVNNEIQSTRVGETAFIEQLWYTWSDRGIDTIRAGYRIRAASAGLSDPKSEFVQNLDRYQRYLLPKGVDNAISPTLAPVCLTLINTNRGRILAHKVYTGRDGVGRYGVFFVHLLVDLPPEFSANNAIALWKSPFWQTADDRGQPNRHPITLERISLSQLDQYRTDKTINARHDTMVEEYLPFVIEAYLTKNLSIQNSSMSQDARKLYIAAPDNVIADMLLGMKHTLPPRLLRDLTFSTYERDVEEATTEIVGTCWPPNPKQEELPFIEQLLPMDFTQQLAVNCYTGKHSPLEKHPQVTNHPSAVRCAQDATSYYLTGSPVKFSILLDEVKDDPHLTISAFFVLYERIVVKKQFYSQADVEIVLTPRSALDYKLSADDLLNDICQKKLFELILKQAGWWQKYRGNVINLRIYSSKLPALVSALRANSKGQALPRAVEIVRREILQLEKSGAAGEPAPEEQFNLMIDFMFCATPPEAEPDVWRSLLQELVKIKKSMDFFHHYGGAYDKGAYARIMKIWAIALPVSKANNELITPLLAIFWAEFGDFLALKLPLEWVEIATKQLVFEQLPPDTKMVSTLGGHAIQTLLQQLIQNPQYWLTAMAFFEVLAKGRYQAKMQFLTLLVESPMGEKDNNVKSVLEGAQLALHEQVIVLEIYGPRYLQDKNMPKTAKLLLKMFEQLGASDLSQDKNRVLVAFLDSSIGNNDGVVQNLLQGLHLAVSEQAPFLERYGPRYLQDNNMPRTTALILDMFGQLGSSNLSQDKIRVLSAFLNSSMGNSDRIVQDLLRRVQLTLSEQVPFLEYYGPRYLQDNTMPGTGILILKMFGQLGSSDLSQEKKRVLSAFLGSSIGNNDSIVPNLLQKVQLTPSEQVPFLEHYGPRYLPDNNMPRTAMYILSIFELLGSSNLSQEKMRVLFSWLNSSQLTRWFNASTLKGEANLSKVLNAAHLHDEESDLFFQHFGKKFIELYPSSETLLRLFDSYKGSKTKSRLDILFVWLECNLDESVLGRLLTVASLGIGERTIFFQRFGKKFISRYPSSEALLRLFDSYGKSGKLRLDMLSIWLECNLEESVLGRLLTAASLNAEECSLFFQSFGKKFIELYPASKTLLDLFARYVSSGLDVTVKGKKFTLRIDLLYIWLSCKVDINVLEWVLNAANLNVDERRRVLLVSGKYYLGRYPQAQTLNRYIPEFLEYLRTVDLAIFKSTSPEKPSLAESFLGILKSRQNLLSRDQELYNNWYTVAQFIRKPSTFSDEPQRVGVSIGWLLEYQIELEANCISLIRELAPVCLSDEDELTNRVTILSSVLAPEDLKTLLYCIAESARDGMWQGLYSKTLLEPCTQLAFRFKPTIQKETDTEDFVKKFLDILLFYTEDEILKALNRHTQQWPDGFKTEWQHYIRKRRTNPGRLFLNPRFSTGVIIALALLLISGFVFSGPTSAYITLAVTANSYSQHLVFTAQQITGPSPIQIGNATGPLTAQKIEKSFNIPMPEPATGILPVTVKANSAVCFTNMSNAPIEIPAGVSLATKDGIQFVTTVTGLIAANNSCTSNPLPIPIQVIVPGADGNIKTNTITAISPKSLDAIAKDNGIATNNLRLTVSNDRDVKGDGTESVTTITDKDLKNANTDLNNQLDKEVKKWIKQVSKDNNSTTGEPVTKVDSVNLRQKGTIVDQTFQAEINAKAAVLSVSNIELGDTIIAQLETGMSQVKDKTLSHYVIAEGHLPSITQLKTQNGKDQNTLQLDFTATAIIVPPITKENIQNLVMGNSLAAAENRIKSNFKDVEKVNVQVKPSFFPWVVARVSDHIVVTIEPGLIATASPNKSSKK